MSQNPATDSSNRDRPPGPTVGTQPTRSEPTDRTPTPYCVLGGGRLGDAIAERLRHTGATVRRVDDGRGDCDVTAALDAAGLDETTTAIVATRSDARNLLLAQRLRTQFGVEEVVVLTNDPDRYDVLIEAGHRPVCLTTALARTVVEAA